MTFPVVAAVRPPSIGSSANGQLPLDLLVNVKGREVYDVYLAPEMAVVYRRLVADCLAATGVQLGISGGGAYRTFAQQGNLFLQRYESPPRVGQSTKTWNGKTWSLRPGMATAAVPGTSNHGLGAAVDLMTFGLANPNVFGSPAWNWLIGNAVSHGLSWELQSEPWHLRLVTLAAPPVTPSFPPPPPPPSPLNEVEMSYYKDDRPVWQIWWVGRDWTDALYAYPINDTPRQGDWDKVSALGVQPVPATFGALLDIMNQQNRPTPIPSASPPVDLAAVARYVEARIAALLTAS